MLFAKNDIPNFEGYRVENEITALGELVAKVNEIVVAAGDAIMDIYQQPDFNVEIKDDNSPLTRADKAAHNILAAALEALDCGPVLSEEDANIPWGERQQWQQYWLVDPLDGTKEFIKRNGEFTVNVALIKDGVPILGSVYAPDKGWLYYGAKGVGAFKVDDAKAATAAESISPAVVPGSDDVWRIVGSRSHQSDDFKEFVKSFNGTDIVAMGSSLKICLVAEGAADLYPRLGLTSEWDTAAAQAVVEAAGGVLLNWETKQPLRYNTKESLLNPFFIVCAQTSPVWLNV
ncbi:3'(2'),5'-bisphosphate nucleotidase CysQ [Teredinibacter turnerae]|uniref:3'(2'),5'-bisphosphate nucleotidase CysQ n=1 Tax=Teredinibacter turnerae TaxID=2426 RepID=UPI00030A8215|nr:3'(2'),5'-bisphosphate nucleotidase CysQ [Teredinibacter turnerae]